MNDVADPWAIPDGAPRPPKSTARKIAWIVAGVAGVLVMGCVAFFAVGLIKSGDVSGRCTAEAERDFDAHRREVLPLPPEARSSNVDFVNDCDSGGGGFTTASTESGITVDAALLELQRAGWVPLDGDELLQYGDAGAVVSRRTGDTRVVVIADKRPDDNPITQITIQTEH